jgi:hypothetical protein
VAGTEEEERGPGNGARKPPLAYRVVMCRYASGTVVAAETSVVVEKTRRREQEKKMKEEVT